MNEKEVVKDNIYQKLSTIQNELKAPKNQYNSFGKYKYRSCEDILEALKPICQKHRTTLVIADEIECINERYYIKAICTLYDCESDKAISTHAYARESLTKKGMDDSQVTGATSSYARKYALNALFSIDDTKDMDTDEAKQVQDDAKKEEKITQEQYDIIKSYINEVSSDLVGKAVKASGKTKLKSLTKQEASKVIEYLKSDTYAEMLTKIAKERVGGNI